MRGRCKKIKGKKLTSVSFAFTHTYTLKKTNIFPFFPQAYMNNFEKCAKTPKKSRGRGVGVLQQPLVAKIPSHMVQNLYSER